MNWRAIVAVTLALAAACGPATSPRTAVSPSTAATAARVAVSPSSQPGPAAEGVLMLAGPGSKYGLYVIASNARMVRSVTAETPSAGGFMPRFSVAGHSVYFLDGDRDLKVLRDDGSVGEVGQLPGGPADRVVFAVSPDEQQIAYSVVHYTSGGTTSTSLSVGPLTTLKAHEVFSGSPIEFPIGWWTGRLVMAVTPYSSIQNPGEVNPYFAEAYHIVDPATANRIYSTSPTCGQPQGPVNAAGTICGQTAGNILALGWDGTARDLGSPNYITPVVLNPDGRRAAAAIGTLGSGPTTIYPISLLTVGGSNPTVATGTPAGWLDADHLLLITGPCCQPSTTASILSVSSKTVTPVSGGMIGDADPYAPFFVSIPNSLT